MSKLFKFIKEKFLSKQFLSFVIIGLINTAINFLVMKGVLSIFDALIESDISNPEYGGILYYISMATSTLVAFIAASLFSYFANAHFTYKQKERDNQTFLQAAVAFIGRFALTYVFTLLIWWLIILIFKVTDDPNAWYRTLSNLIASVLMIPPFYLVLGLIFKKTKERIESKKENAQEETENKEN